MSRIDLKKNIAFTTGGQALTMVASFVVNLLLARFLGPELRGQFVYLFTINSMVWMLLDLGISKATMYSLQHDKQDPNKLYSFALVYFGFSLLLGLAFFHFFGAKVIGQKGSGYGHLVLLALGVYIAVFQIYSRQKFMFIGLNHIHDYALSLVLPTVSFMLVLLAAFWFLPQDFKMEGSYLLNVLVLIMVSLFMHFRLVRRIDFHFRWDWPLFFHSYGLGFKAFLSEYMLILMTRIDLMILKHLSNFAQLGVYSLAVNFLDMINFTANTIGVVLLNKFSSLADDTASLLILRKIFVLMIAFDLICILGMVAIGLPVIRLLYGVEFQGAYYAFIYLIPAIFGLTLGGLFNTFLWSKGFPIFTIIAPAVTTVIKIGLSYLLIPRYGMYGAAISSSIVYLLWYGSLLAWYFGTHRDKKISQLMIRREDITQMGDMLRELKLRFLAGK